MNIATYIPLHYGKEYFKESLLSFVDLVDDVYILYSKEPSYGFGTTLPNPDTKEELYSIAIDNLGGKLHWIDISAHSEGEHRNYGHDLTSKYDLVFTSDADEVWFKDILELAIKEVFDDKIHQTFGVSGKIDIWRSFDWQMVDWFTPVRFLKKNCGGAHVVHCPYLHMGYAQSQEIIEYKLSIHGHKSEIIDVHSSVENYLDKVFGWSPDNNVQDFYHPASKDIWREAVPYDKTLMPDFMKVHPNYNKVVI